MNPRRKNKSIVFKYIMYTITLNDYFSNSKIRVLKNLGFEMPKIRSIINELCQEGFIVPFGNGYLAYNKAFEAYQRKTCNYLKNPLAKDVVSPKAKRGLNAIVKAIFTTGQRNKIYKMQKEDRIKALKRIFINASGIVTKKQLKEIFKRLDSAILNTQYETKKELFEVLSAFVCPFAVTYKDSTDRRIYIDSLLLQMNEYTLTKAEAAEMLSMTIYKFNKLNIVEVKKSPTGRKYYSRLAIIRLKNNIEKHANK